MQSRQRSPAQEAAVQDFSSKLDAFSRAGEPAPAVQSFGVQQQAASMLQYSHPVLALPKSQQLGTAQQAAGAHCRLQCMSNWSRSVQAMNAAPTQRQPQHSLHPPSFPSCTVLPSTGGAWPYGQAAPFQSHQQACMDGFQRFLGQDSPRAATAAAAAAPTLPEVSADQQPTRTQPMGPTEAEQEPRQRPDSATGPQKAASLPSMLRPIARTAPVPLTGLYGKDVPATARRSWRLPRIEDLPELPATKPACPDTLQRPNQGHNHGGRQPEAAEAHREAAVPSSNVSDAAHAEGAIDAPDKHSPSAPEQAVHMTCSEALDSSVQPEAAGQAPSNEGVCSPQLSDGAASPATAHEAEAPLPRSPPSSPPSKGRHTPQLKNSLVMRRQSPEWLDCSAASANASGGQDVSVREGIAVQHSLSSKACTASAEHAGSTRQHREQALLDTCESPQRRLQAGSMPQAAAQGRVLRSGRGSVLAVVQADAEQPAAMAADSTANEATPAQAPFSAVQAVREDAGAASALAAPVLAPSSLPSPTASPAQAAAKLQPSPVTPFSTDTEVSGSPGADTPEDVADATEGLQAPTTQAGACPKPAAADAAVRPGRAAAQKQFAAKQWLDMQPAAAEQSAPMRARRERSHGTGQCLDPVPVHDGNQRTGRVSRVALRSSVGVLSSDDTRGKSIPVRACNMSLLSRDSLAELFALAPIAWQRAHGMKLDSMYSCSASQPAISEASEGVDSPSLQAAPGVPGPGQIKAMEQPCRRRRASDFTLRARAASRGESRMRAGLQIAVKQEPHAAHASEAAKLAAPPPRQMNKELAMLQAEAVPDVDRLAKLSTAGHVTRHQASALSERERRVLLRQKVPPAGRRAAPLPPPKRPRAAAERASAAGPLISSRVRPAGEAADGKRAPEVQRAHPHQALSKGPSVSRRRVALQPRALAEQRSKLRQRPGRGELALKSRLARADFIGTREEAIRMRMDQKAAVTNARRDIGIMKMPLKVSSNTQRSRAIRARAASAHKQQAARKAQALPSKAAPVAETLGRPIALQQASGAELQAPSHGFTTLVPAMLPDLSPTRDALDLVVPPVVGDLAAVTVSAPAQRQQGSSMDAAAAPTPDLARPAEHASSAPHNSQFPPLQGRIACQRVARRTEPCTEEAALLEAPVPVLGSAAPCDEVITGALGRLKRVPGGDPLQNKQVARLCNMIRANSREFQADGRVLRLKQYVSSDVRPAHIDAILDALAANTRVEVLYIQNFEWGMLDAQLEHLSRVLTSGHIWALNVGENFQISIGAWERFTKALEATAVGYMYVSEHHLGHTDLKIRMRDVIRVNRKAGPRRDPEVICKVGNMWFNPKMPDVAPRRPKALSPRALPAPPLVRPLAAALGAINAGSSHRKGPLQKAAAARRAATARRAAQELERRKALEYHPQITPPKAYGPKRVAPDTFTHLEASASASQQQPKRSRAGHLATRPLDYDGPMLCTICGVTETPCWRRHHRTRALLCNRCGVKANALGAKSSHAYSTYSVRPRGWPSQETTIPARTVPVAERSNRAQQGKQLPLALRAPRADRFAYSSAPAQRPAQKQSLRHTSVRPPKKVKYACEDCGEPVEQDMSNSPDTILCSACIGNCPETRARRLQGDSILSPRQVASMSAQVAEAVRSMRRIRQLDGSHLRSFVPGQHAALSRQPDKAPPQPGTEYRSLVEQISLLSGTLRPCTFAGPSELPPIPALAAAAASSDSTVLPSAIADPSKSPATEPAAFFQLGQHSAPSQLDCSKRMPADGNSTEPGDAGMSADMQPEMSAAAASQGKRKLDSSVSETERAAKRPCEGASIPELEPHQALVPSPGDVSPAEGCPRSVSCAASPEQSGSAQRRMSAQTDSRVRMKQRELVPVQDLLATKYRLPGCSPPKNLLSEDEELLTLWLWTHKPRSGAGESWAPSIRSRAF